MASTDPEHLAAAALPEGSRLLVRHWFTDFRPGGRDAAPDNVQCRIVELSADDRLDPQGRLPAVVCGLWGQIAGTAPGREGSLFDSPAARGGPEHHMTVGLFSRCEVRRGAAHAPPAGDAVDGAELDFPDYRIVASITRAPPPPGTSPEVAASAPYVDLGFDYFSGGSPRPFILTADGVEYLSA